jgi:hypothetical protein
MATELRSADFLSPLPAGASTMVDLDHVTKQFQGKRQVTALDDVSLVIPRGQNISRRGRRARRDEFVSASSAWSAVIVTS